MTDDKKIKAEQMRSRAAGMLTKVCIGAAAVLGYAVFATYAGAAPTSQKMPDAFKGHWSANEQTCRDRDYFKDAVLELADETIMAGEDGATIKALKVQSDSVIFVTANFGGGSADSVMRFTLLPDKMHLIFHWMDNYKQDETLMRCAE